MGIYSIYRWKGRHQYFTKNKYYKTMCHGNMCGGGSCHGGVCGSGGCNCSPGLTLEILERKEKVLKEKLEWVEKKKKELASSDK